LAALAARMGEIIIAASQQSGSVKKPMRTRHSKRLMN
jgi:hypothetical protein